MRKRDENSVSPECAALEQSLSGMLARVERRRALSPVNAADGEMNKVMASGLREAVSLTQAFINAAHAGYSPLYRARKLVALADGMPRFVDMMRGLEGDKRLSPLFERVLDREYAELRKVVGQMRDTVNADGDKLLAILPKKPPGPDVASFVASCLFMPFALALGVISGVAQGISEAQRERNNPPTPQNPPKPTPHLTLVHSQ